MRRYEPIAGITVGASGTDSTIPIPANRRLLLARLYAAGVAAGPVNVFGADVLSDIQVFVGTNLLWIITAQELLDQANFSGENLVPSASVGIPLYFADPHRASVMDEQVTAWDLFGSAPLTIKARTKDALTGVTLSVVLVYDDQFTTNSAGARILNIVKNEPVNLGSLGTVADILSPVVPVDLPIQRIFIYPEAGNSILAVRVTINNSQIIHDMTAEQNAETLKDYGLVSTPGNGNPYPVVFDTNGQLFDGLAPQQSIKLHIQQSAAGQVKLVLQRRTGQYS